MDPHELLRVLRERWRAVLVCTLLATAAGALVSVAAPPRYEADAQLMVLVAAPSTSPDVAFQLAQQLTATYAQLATGRPVVEAAARQVGLDRPVDDLRADVTAAPIADTNLLTVTVQDSSATRAQALANALGAQLARRVAQLQSPAGDGAQPATVVLAEPAALPRTPVWPRPALNLLVGVLAGALAGMGVAVYRHRSPRAGRTWADLEEESGLPTLGVVPIRPPGPGDVPADEAFHRLRTGLEARRGGDQPQSVLVTSAVPGEGRTTVACNLAVAFAGSGLQVALVEADLRNPGMSVRLGLAPDAGLADVLAGADAEQVQQCWLEGAGGICVLTAGRRVAHPAELIRSEAMAELLKYLAGRFDLVVVDSPPLTTAADAAVLARIAQSVLLVVAAATARNDVARALHDLALVDAPLQGTVLTTTAPRRRRGRRDRT
ncbi:MAG TPA: polysaccharide biosynthesis tyrosine autokinase [Mycobacteriales bacterium]|nr:polysaccharide biosynthesis tyrosine autokinase [Mycobacteriales bacterium]